MAAGWGEFQQTPGLQALDVSRNQLNWSNESGELRKAVVGFSGVAMPVVVSAGWGTGTFDGDPELKLLLQWLAASFAGKEQLVYEADRTPVGPNVERVVAAQRAAGASPSAVLV